MVRLRLAATTVVAAGVIGCGGSNPREKAETPVSAVAAPPPATEPLVQVAAPAEVFAVVRVANPAKAVDMGIQWSGLPLDWRALVAKEAPGLERLVAFDAPADFVAMLDPSAATEPRAVWAFAVGVASVDATTAFFRDQGRKVVRDGASGYRVEDSDLKCGVTPALGTAPARVVCSDDMNGLSALEPYMARGLPTESFGPAEVHAHVVAEPLRRRYGAQAGLVRTVGVPFALRELELDQPKFDRALRDALYGCADEVIALVADLDRLDFDVRLTPDATGLDVSSSLAFIGQKSWSAQTLEHAAGHAAPPPDFFWKLPEDVTSASFSVYSEPDRMRGVADGIRALLDGWLDYQGLGEKRRAALSDAVFQAFTFAAKSAYASLPVTPAAARDTTDAGKLRETMRSTLGAHLFVVDAEGDKLTRVVSEMVHTVSDPAFRARLIKTKVVRQAELPTARERPLKDKGLPAGVKAFEFDVPASAFEPESAGAKTAHGAKKAPKSTAAPLAFVVLAMPDGPLTWFAAGTDEKGLIERLRQVHSSGAATLGARDGLAALHAGTALSAGFTSLSAALANLLSPGIGKELHLDENALGRLPHKGETPVVFQMAVDAQGPKMTATARVPQAVVEDLVALGASQIPLH